VAPVSPPPPRPTSRPSGPSSCTTRPGAVSGRTAASTSDRTPLTTHPEQPDGLLGPAAIRELAQHLDLRPTKTLGQNFLHDANTIRRIVRTADLRPEDVVLEVGPGLGSLTLGLLPAAARVLAVEIDPRLADLLPVTVGERRPDLADRLTVVTADALRVRELPGPPPTALVANLPYNVAVPVLLHLLDLLPTLDRALILVQAEVAERLAAPPGGSAYGVPSVKAAWYGEVRRAGAVGRKVFWPEPNVDSGLVALVRRPPPPGDRLATFAVIDAAFAMRRKRLRAAGIDPALRGEQLSVTDFARLAATEPVEP
jgi:16S rRNA (adenine1518-N6/adenine1519-N6)-dimethyltransferase